MKWFNRLIVWILPIFPKPFIWIFSKRYIAGKTLDEAIQTAKSLNEEGCLVTMDVLGEDISDLKEATAAKEECLRMIAALHEFGIKGSASIKLTQLGLQIDPEACYQNVKEILTFAKQSNCFVRIDMEDHTTTDATLELYRRLRKDFNNLGTVIQAYLFRSQDDVKELIKDKIANLRVCKGIYIEPKSIAFKRKNQIRDNYKDIIHLMLDSGSFVGIATHDKVLVGRSLSLIDGYKISRDKYEFQMLLGVTEKLRRKLVQDGHAMRIYVPYGEQWYAYSMRRLAENPGVAGHIVKNLFVRS